MITLQLGINSADFKVVTNYHETSKRKKVGENKRFNKNYLNADSRRETKGYQYKTIRTKTYLTSNNFKSQSQRKTV